MRRWLSLFPLRDTAGYALPVSQARVGLLAQAKAPPTGVTDIVGELAGASEASRRAGLPHRR